MKNLHSISVTKYFRIQQLDALRCNIDRRT